MRLAVIGSSHGCWACTSTEKFPNLSLKELGPVNVQRVKNKLKLQAAWKLNADSESALTEYIAYVKTMPSLKRAEVLSHSGNTGVLFTEWVHEHSSYDVVTQNNCIPIAPIVQENGYDVHTVLCDNPKQVAKLMSSMNEIGDTKIFKLGKFEPDQKKFNLTDKQIQALAVAAYNGYYSWPRKITLEELARLNNSSRRGFQEHLRRAEAKAFPALLKDVLELNPHKKE